ncbi:MAG TPA: phage holin family protein [Candidatus Omnitrophota bacterium]|nr:phage holin family protein [Candidatus Omnitrophota bacterium]
MNDIHPDRSLASLFTELSRELGTLFRQEIQLAKVEATEKAKQAGAGAAEVAVGGLILFVAFQALVATAILGLSYVVEPWLAALIVAVAIAVVGAVVLAKGLSNLRGDNLTPRRTIDTLRANTQWAKEQLR